MQGRKGGREEGRKERGQRPCRWKEVTRISSGLLLTRKQVVSQGSPSFFVGGVFGTDAIVFFPRSSVDRSTPRLCIQPTKKKPRLPGTTILDFIAFTPFLQSFYNFTNASRLVLRISHRCYYLAKLKAC